MSPQNEPFKTWPFRGRHSRSCDATPRCRQAAQQLGQCESLMISPSGLRQNELALAPDFWMMPSAPPTLDAAISGQPAVAAESPVIGMSRHAQTSLEIFEEFSKLMSHSMQHPPDTELTEFLLGALSADRQTEVEVHLAECTECESRAAGIAANDDVTELFQRAAAPPSAEPLSTMTGLPLPTKSPASGSLDPTAWLTSPRASGDPTPSPPQGLIDHPRYRIIRPLGWGGMGQVWLAQHLVMDRPVALKVIRKELTSNAAVLARFRREVQLAAKLNHPNIATAYDAEQIGDIHFLVMEFIDGRTLSDRVRTGPLAVGEACFVVREAALGLANAHAAGLVHRDVKPGNLIQAENGSVKVLDFGLAIVARSDGQLTTGENLVMGTPDYVSPEQAEDPHSADARSDLYSLGCTLYHLLAGHVPFRDESILRKIDAHRTQRAEPLRDVPIELRRIVERLMAKSPDQRFQTAREAVDALLPFCTDMTHSKDLAEKRRRSSSSSTRLRTFTGVVTASVLLLGFFVWQFDGVGQFKSRPTDSTSSPDSVTSQSPVDTVVEKPHERTEPAGNRYPLLDPSSFGGGALRNIQVVDQLLKINTMAPSTQLWLNYHEPKVTEGEVHCRIRFLKSEKKHFFKIIFESATGEDLAAIILNRGADRFLEIEQLAVGGTMRKLASQQCVADFANSWTDLVVRLRGPKIQCLVANELLLEAAIEQDIPRHVCLAAFNCQMEVHDPVLIVPSN